jgi:cysteine-rich repeat protein
MKTQRLGRVVAIAGVVIAAAVAAPLRAELLLTVTFKDDFPDAAPGDGVCRTTGGGCSLRAAVQEANATPGRDVVRLPEGGFEVGNRYIDVDGDESDDLDLTDDISIEGEGADRSHVYGSGRSGIFEIKPGVRAELRDFSISDGLDPTASGILNWGHLRLSDVVVVRNVGPIPSGSGGLWNLGGVAYIERCLFEANVPMAISNEGTLTIVHSTFRNNGPSVAIANEREEGSLTLIASEIADQSGSAIYSQGTTHIERTRIHHTRPGWAVLNPGARVTVLDSLIDHNEGGGINSDGDLRIERSTLRANSAPPEIAVATTAGVAGVAPSTAVTNTDRALIVDSSILDHRGGGLVNDRGSMTLVNVTVSGNTTGLDGGGISNNGVLEVRSSTITANTAASGAGGITTLADSSNSVRIANTIIAGNHGPGGSAADCSGPITSLGFNLLGTEALCEGLVPAAGDLLGVDPGLGPLGDNGGSTPTHAPLTGSAAIDAGSPDAPGASEAACPAADQRGAGRPQGGGCDIGAFEETTRCGDGAQDAGEACDDGNVVAGDCCSPLCAVEPMAGDCDGNGTVDIAELVLAVDLALTEPPVRDCRAADADGDGQVGISDLLRAVGSALEGCRPS